MMAAGPASSWCKETPEKINYTKLSRLLVDGGTQAVRSVFDGIHPPSSLTAILNANKTTLQNLKKPKGKVLNNKQWDKLYTPSARGINPTSKDFDITLLFVLLRNICGLTPPVVVISSCRRSWDELPPVTDNSLEANLARIKYYRNNTIAHKPNTEINDVDFEQYWQDISSALLSLGLNQEDIDGLKSARLGEKDYNQLLYDWYISDEDIKTQLEDLKSNTADIKSNTKDIKSDTAAIKGGVDDLKIMYAEAHKQDKLIDKLAVSDFKPEITTRCKSFHPNTRQWILDQVKSYVDSDQPESCIMLITAGPGMGKSTIAAKICEMYKNLGCLGGCHFFQFSNSTRNNPRLMLQSIARQMCDSVPGYDEALEKKLQTNLGKEITEMNCEELFTVMFEEPLHKIKCDDSTRNKFVIVLDAIDECCSNLKYELQEVLTHKLSILPSWLRFVITTRPPPSFSALESKNNIVIDSKGPENKLDLVTFFTDKLELLYGDTDDHSTVIQQLVEMSDGYFLVAFFVIDHMQKENITSPSEVMGMFPNGISSVYEKYFKRVKTVLLPYISEEERFYVMLEAIVASKDPIPIHMTYRILCLKSEREVPRTERKTRNNALNSLHSLFPVENDHVAVFHKSVVDWLIAEKEHDFSVRKPDGNRVLRVPSNAQKEKRNVDKPLDPTDSEEYANKAAASRDEFSVRVEDGNKILANQCHDVLSDIRNGKKDLDKPLDLTDSEKYALQFLRDLIESRDDEKVKKLFDYFVLSALISFCKFQDLTMMEFNISILLIKLFDICRRCTQFYGTQHHATWCPFSQPSNFGRCVEFVLQVANIVDFSEEGITLKPIEILKKHHYLSYCEVKQITTVELQKNNNYKLPNVSVLVCGESGFLLVRDSKQNTVAQKYQLDGTCVNQKSFLGLQRMCMSPDHRFIVATKIIGKGDIEILDATTLELVTSYPSPNVIRSCHVFGDQPWYIVIRCYNNKIYVMEGETGRKVSTITTVGQHVEVEAVSNKGHILLGTSLRYVNNLFTDEDGHFLEEMSWRVVSRGMAMQQRPVSGPIYNRKLFLCHFKKPELVPIYPRKVGDVCCSIDGSEDGSGYGESVGFSREGHLLAFHYKNTIFIVKTFDCSLYKRVFLGPGFRIFNENGISFLSEKYIVVYNGSRFNDKVIMIINIHTNEIEHRYYCTTSTAKLQVLPKKQGEPCTFITECHSTERCAVLLYKIHNFDL